MHRPRSDCDSLSVRRRGEVWPQAAGNDVTAKRVPAPHHATRARYLCSRSTRSAARAWRIWTTSCRSLHPSREDAADLLQSDMRRPGRYSVSLGTLAAAAMSAKWSNRWYGGGLYGGGGDVTALRARRADDGLVSVMSEHLGSRLVRCRSGGRAPLLREPEVEEEQAGDEERLGLAGLRGQRTPRTQDVMMMMSCLCFSAGDTSGKGEEVGCAEAVSDCESRTVRNGVILDVGWRTVEVRCIMH